MKHRGTVKIETDRLILRRFDKKDLEQIYYNCWCEFDVWKWTNYPKMTCIADAITNAGLFTTNWLNAYENLDRYSWAIQLKSTGEVIGRLFGMHPDDRIRQVELAYELGSKWWNQGIMTEAVSAIISFFIEEVGLNRVFAYHADKNPASGEVMKKCGMVYEGTQRQACVCNNGLFDKVMYAILAEDYFGRKVI